MGMLARAFAILLCWILLPTAASAHGEAPCERHRATPTSIEAVRADDRAWSGRCVSLRGIAVNARLFADRLATLEPIGGFGRGVRRSIVLNPRGRSRRERKPMMVEVTGTIGSCADQNAAVAAMQAAAPADIIMISGYCHTSLETFIRAVHIRVLSRASISRLLEAEVPADRRELVVVPSGIARRTDHIAAARAMAAAMATGDELAYRRLARPAVQQELDSLGGRPAPGWLRRAVREAHADFAGSAALRRDFAAISPLATHPERVLVDRAELSAPESGRRPTAFVVCWCKTTDCAGRWPVAAFDADNEPERPYLCARTTDYILGPSASETIQVDVRASANGFAEPSWLHR